MTDIPSVLTGFLLKFARNIGRKNLSDKSK